MNVFQRAIVRLFVPKYMRRKGKRAYQGALISRLTADWRASQLSPDAEIRNSIRKLRDRSRELIRNNPYAKQAKRTTQLNVVGTGMKFQSLVKQIRGGKRDERINDAIEEKWEEWTQSYNCDCAGRHSFHEFEWILAGALPESGEAIFRIVRQQFGDSKVPLALQVRRRQKKGDYTIVQTARNMTYADYEFLMINGINPHKIIFIYFEINKITFQ